MIYLPCWIINPGDYREIAIAIQFTNCTATWLHIELPSDH
jgi:hypothetical protein